MVNYRKILRLYSLNYSQLEIGASVHSSRSTIQEILNLASVLKISWPLTPETTNAVLESLPYPERINKGTDRMMPGFPKIHRELARKEVTLSLLWTEYTAEAQAAGKTFTCPPSLVTFIAAGARVSKATMCIQRKPAFQKRVGCRRSTYEQEEQEFMHPDSVNSFSQI